MTKYRVIYIPTGETLFASTDNSDFETIIYKACVQGKVCEGTIEDCYVCPWSVQRYRDRKINPLIRAEYLIEETKNV
jgi:hypothetical protein